MIEIIYKSIPGLLFEPIAVAALLGLAVAAVMYWKRHERFYWIFAVAIVFMISWRTVIEIISGRYAAILIYPGILATAFFCFQTEWLVKYIPKFPEKWRKIVPWLFVIGLGIASLVKTLHFNPYSSHIIKAGRCIAEDAKKYKHSQALVTHLERRRIKYYSGVQTIPFYNDKDNENKTAKHLAACLRYKQIETESLYIVTFEQTKDPVGNLFRELPEIIQKKIVLIGDFPQNRKKKRATRVYRYDVKKAWKFNLKPAEENAEPGKHVYTFEKTHPEGSPYYSNVEKYFKTHPKKELFQPPTLHNFPVLWSVYGTGGYRKGSNAELFVKDNIFHLKSDSLITTYTIKSIPSRSYSVRMRVSGTPGTAFTLNFHGYNIKNKWNAYYYTPQAVIPGNGIFDYTFTIPEGHMDKSAFVRPTIHLEKGELQVHRIDLY